MIPMQTLTHACKLGPTTQPVKRLSQGWASTSDRPEAPGFIRHLANTAGAARFPDARYDMVRIGLGLYGLDASGTMKNLQPIGRFHTRISHLHDVTAGTPVGYGATGFRPSYPAHRHSCP